MAFEIAVASDISTVAIGHCTFKIAQIRAKGIDTQPRLDGIGLVGANDGESC